MGGSSTWHGPFDRMGIMVIRKPARPPGPGAEDAYVTASKLNYVGIGAGIGAAATSVVLGLSSALAAYFARRVVTPDQFRQEDLAILAVTGRDRDAHVILPANDDTTVPGTYSLYFDRGRGHARIGPIVSYIPGEDTVTRRIEEVYSGNVHAAVRGWWGGSVYPDPAALGHESEEVHVPVAGGSAPAWLVPAPPEHDSRTWAIMVHGRGATRTEGLRAVPTARTLGMTSLLISYRNDGEAPAAEDRRYGLGMTEWRDVEAAIEYARTKGAKDIVLFGWSMGGAISLQTVDLSEHGHLIRALVLDGPVINWVDVLAHQARLNNIPAPIGQLGQLLLTHPAGRSLTGLAAPVNLKSMDWVHRAAELQTPTLIIHSAADEYVPSGPSKELAGQNPAMVSFVEFARGRHTKEWNVDRTAWHQAVSNWLAPVLSRADGRHYR